MGILVCVACIYLLVSQTGLKEKKREIWQLRVQLFQEGDIMFQTSKSSQSLAIQMATHSKISHTGMIVKKGKGLFVLEAVQPVKLTPIEDWINKGDGMHFVVKRLREADFILTKEVKQRMENVAVKYLGKKYDPYFEWSDTRIYCSELVWKIYKQAANIELGHLEKLRNFDLSDKQVQELIHKRYGKNIPWEEPVISPAGIFHSGKLVTVYQE